MSVCSITDLLPVEIKRKVIIIGRIKQMKPAALCNVQAA